MRRRRLQQTEIAMNRLQDSIFKQTSGVFGAHDDPDAQHYYTFRSRFEKYGVRVEMLNRLVSPRSKRK